MLSHRQGRAAWLLILVAALAAALDGWDLGSAGAAGVKEFERPVLTYPTAVAVAPDGSVWIASTYADTLVRFDPERERSEEVKLPLRSHPAGLLVDARGAVWFSATGLVGRLARASARASEFAVPSVVAAKYSSPMPWLLALDAARDEVWFTIHSHGAVGRVSARAEVSRGVFAPRELKLGDASSRPYGIAADGRGTIWVAEMGADRVTGIDAAGGGLRRLRLPPGSRPRGVAVGTDGSIWVTLFGTGRLLRLDPGSLGTRDWLLPSGAGAGPAAVAVDRRGRVWVSAYGANTIVRLEPSTGGFESFPLPTPYSRVQAIATDARGRLWYVGSFSGRLGVIE